MQSSVTMIDDRRARRNVAVLVVAQATIGAQMPMIFVVGGLAGSMLTSNPCFATLPISMVVFGSMCAAPLLSGLMQNHGRTTGFTVGALAGATGAAIAAAGLYVASFSLLLLGSFISGIYMSAHGFYRFAAADCASSKFRPKAISWVMAGGLIAAIVGPQLNKLLFDLPVLPVLGGIYLPNPFLGTYLAIIVINLAGLFLFSFLDIPLVRSNANNTTADKSEKAHKPVASVRSRTELLKEPAIAVAIICAMVSYALMNLVMTSTPLAVVGCGFTSNQANDIVSAHVLAMFIPSFFTGHLIVRFGAQRIISAGLVILALAGLVAYADVRLSNFYAALVLLGVGWNFGFIGATSLLADNHSPEERGRAQGLNDMLVFGFVTLASLSSGGLMNCTGETAIDGWHAVNFAMLPFLLLAATSLWWLAHNRRAAQRLASH